jgi:hypothetical protein
MSNGYFKNKRSEVFTFDAADRLSVDKAWEKCVGSQPRSSTPARGHGVSVWTKPKYQRPSDLCEAGAVVSIATEIPFAGPWDECPRVGETDSVDWRVSWRFVLGTH